VSYASIYLHLMVNGKCARHPLVAKGTMKMVRDSDIKSAKIVTCVNSDREIEHF
jgi:hypothetical protein